MAKRPCFFLPCREPFDLAQDRELVERLVEWQMNLFIMSLSMRFIEMGMSTSRESGLW